MPTVLLFITLATTLAMLLACIVLWPWLRADKAVHSNQLLGINIAVFKARLAELQADYDQQKISEAAYRAQKVELERQLLQASAEGSADGSLENATAKPAAHKAGAQWANSRKARLILLIWIPLLMGMGYGLVHDTKPVRALWQAQDKVGTVADDLLTGRIELPPEWAAEDSIGLINALQTNVHHHAYDAERWLRLADVFLALNANERGLEALARAYRLHPTDETIAVRYAQTKFFLSNGQLDSDSRNALTTVLQQHPNHQGAQMLMAMGEARAGNYDRAQAWVQRLQVAITAKEGDHSAALQSLDEMRQSIGQQALASQQAQRDASGNNSNARPKSNQQNQPIQVTVQVTVQVNPAIRPLITNGDTLFVTAKAAAGGAPLAVKRLDAMQLLQKSEQGLTLQLSDSDAMMPAHTLSSAKEAGTPIVVTARVSKSGQAMSASGDLSANQVPIEWPKPVAAGDESSQAPLAITIEINQQVP